MLQWFRALMPKEEKFFDLYARHADLVVEAATELELMLSNPPELARHCNRIIQLEHDADEITREVMQAVRRSFITPFDRSDVTGLIQSMDDAVDKMQRVVKTVQLYELTEFEPDMRAMAGAAVQSAKMMADTIGMLPRINANASRIAELTEAIVKLEAEADDLHDAGMKTLYREHGQSDPVRFFIGRALYIDLEGVVDSIEDVANKITSITIENI